jgi:hypothetical protein
MTETIRTTFELGRILATPGALEALEESGETSHPYLQRHASKDWGEVCSEDREENELALREDFRLFSVYRLKDGTRLWIITEADRSATTILLPSEY